MVELYSYTHAHAVDTGCPLLARNKTIVTELNNLVNLDHTSHVHYRALHKKLHNYYHHNTKL